MPMDERVRTELIDLMARILVTVFEAQGGKVDESGLVQSQNHAGALARKAIVYLRQSSEKQVRQYKESQRLQYDVAERMCSLGWKVVEIIGIDLGSSAGIASARREGFERVLSSVALGEVGIVGSWKVSRLSRTDKDWCRLLEVCQIFGTLIADEQHIYGLNSLDDQLVLGIKGTLSVVELKVLRQRMQAAKSLRHDAASYLNGSRSVMFWMPWARLHFITIDPSMKPCSWCSSNSGSGGVSVRLSSGFGITTKNCPFKESGSFGKFHRATSYGIRSTLAPMCGGVGR